MFANERRERICSLLEHKPSVTVAELTERFSVSVETIRRDLFALEQQNRLRRAHGGAIALNSFRPIGHLEERMQECWQEKLELARTAAAQICENDVIAVDAGSTAAAFAQVLAESFSRLTVVTYSLDVFQTLSGRLHPILCGGEFYKEENAFTGPLTVQTLRNFHVSKSFLCPSAVSLRHGIMDFMPEFLPLQQLLPTISDQTFVLADHGKFETTAFIRLSELTPQLTLITDSALDAELKREYREHGIRILSGRKGDA